MWNTKGWLKAGESHVRVENIEVNYRSFGTCELCPDFESVRRVWD